MSATRSEATVECWACGAAAAPGPEPAPYVLYRCPRCELVFQPERTADELRELYAREYFDQEVPAALHTDDEAGRLREVRAHVAHVRKFTRREGGGRRLLEIGPAGGLFLSAIRGAGFDPVGIEPAEREAATAAERFGLDVRQGFAEELDLPAASFDVACMWHVIEHILAPRPVLERVREVLRPGGLLFLEVPNAGGVEAAGDLVGWPAAYLEYHVSQFGPRALEALVRAAGFEAVHTRTYPSLRYIAPRELLGRNGLHLQLQLARRLRMFPWRSHPSKHDLLRLVARVPGG